MNTVTFTKQAKGQYVASTGEQIGFYQGTELWGRGSSGWYITEINGDFRGLKFDSLLDAKYHVMKRHNIVQAAQVHFAKIAESVNA